MQAIEVAGERLFSTQNTQHKRENQAALSKIFNIYILLSNCGSISHKKQKGKSKEFSLYRTTIQYDFSWRKKGEQIFLGRAPDLQ